jgi:ribokinase
MYSVLFGGVGVISKREFLNPPQRWSGSREGFAGPIVVAGGHGQSLFLRVEAIPREGETVLAIGFEEPVDGGKASNQAVAIAMLGAPARLLTLVGNDERGRRWRAFFQRSRIDITYVVEREGPTDVGFVMLPPSGIPAIASSRDLGAHLDDEFVRSAADAFDGASVVVCQLEAPPACALASFRLGRAAGATTILNPAPAAPLDPELVALTDILVPNEIEAAALHGEDGPPSLLASQLAERYRCTVIVTAGADGCYVKAPGLSLLHHSAPSVSAVDTTGAGDAFVGALAVSLRAGEKLESAVMFATSAASLSVTRPGTMPSYPTLAELRETSVAVGTD